MILSDLELLEIVSARLCHDLAGPVGAISNGLDFLRDEDNTMKDKAESLVEDSASQAVIRIQLFRYLYGTTLPAGEANLSNLKNLMEKFLITSKMQLDWPEDNLFVQGIAINHKTAKLILSMIMASSSFLLNAGSISVRLINNNNKCRIEISAKDKNIRINQNSIDILDKQVDKSAITNKNIHFYLIRRLSKLLNIDSFVEIKDQQADFIAQLP